MRCNAPAVRGPGAMQFVPGPFALCVPKMAILCASASAWGSIGQRRKRLRTDKSLVRTPKYTAVPGLSFCADININKRDCLLPSIIPAIYLSHWQTSSVSFATKATCVNWAGKKFMIRYSSSSVTNYRAQATKSQQDSLEIQYRELLELRERVENAEAARRSKPLGKPSRSRVN